MGRSLADLARVVCARFHRSLRVQVAFAVLAILSSGSAGADALGPICNPAATEKVTLNHATDPWTIVLSDDRLATLAGIARSDAVRDDSFALMRVLATGRAATMASLGQQDRYGRHPVLVFTGETSLQEALIGAGLAVVRPDPAVPLACQHLFLETEARARARGVGLWRNPEIAIFDATDYDRISKQVGRFAIVEGKILSVGTRKNRTYLNFGTYWSQDMTVEIDAQDRPVFGGADALERLTWKRVRVRGFVESKGGPLITIRSPIALEIAGPAKPLRRSDRAGGDPTGLVEAN